ncbi:MAG: hypothetical protein M9938_00040 [Solirubrobacterales bacterium]|nr:hypothetical protein [Solirubrobacterales bacterium]
MVAGTTGLEGSARGRMALLAAVIALVAGWIVTSLVDGAVVVGLLVSALAGLLSCAVVSSVIAGATRRGGTAALVLIAVFVALVILAITLIFPYFALLPAAGLIWLGLTRRRKAARKHAGLRILR